LKPYRDRGVTLEQAEARRRKLGDTPVARELRRRLAGRRDRRQPEGLQAMTWKRLQQAELLERVHFGIEDMTRSRDLVQAQIAALEQDQTKLEQRIEEARQSGREDLAEQALTLQNSGQSQIAELKSQLDQVLAKRVKLTTAAQRLQAKIDGAGGATAG
jgi:phage I-like protein